MSNAPIQHPVVDLKSGIMTPIWIRYIIGAVDGGTP